MITSATNPNRIAACTRTSTCHSSGIVFVSAAMIKIALASFAITAIAAPTEAFAHASGRGFVLLLPTEAMQWSGAAAVALSFGLLLLVPAGFLRGLFREWTIAQFPLPRVETLISLIGLAMWAALVMVGFIGARDPLANPLPLTVWTLLWVGLTVACALFGNLWSILNPWSGLVRLIETDKPPLRLPDGVGYAPALIGLLAFGWFEIVDLAPDDPARLASAVAVYWLITLLAMLAFGERAWLERGEFLHVFFGFIGRLAPLRFTRGQGVRITLSFPGAGLIHSPPPPLSGALFVLVALATVSFDGTSETWWWLAQLGINPLEFPGRSAVVEANTNGLFLASALLSSVFILSLMLGLWLTKTPPSLYKAICRLALSIIPISLAYHFAHYLVAFLVNGQYALATATDPLASGADILGLGQFYVTTSFLNTQETVSTIWQVQSGAIIIGHVIAVCVAHRMALDLWRDPHRAAIGQIPIALLMVAYTFFGLWLLAQPTA